MIRTILDWIIVVFCCFYLGLFFTNYSFIFSPIIDNNQLSSRWVSNIVGPTFIFIFLLLMRWFVDKKHFTDSPIIRIVLKISKNSDKNLVIAAACFLFFLLVLVSLFRHFSLNSTAYDLGIFDQAVWNTTKGNWFFSSLKHNINLMGDHFEPMLILFAPLYLIWPSPVNLLLAQALLLASAIIPLYLIAKLKIKDRVIIFALIIAYMLSQTIRGIAFSDFHMECFIVPLLFWSYYFLIKRRDILFFITLILLLGCKEDMAFIIMGFSLFSCFIERRIILGISLLLIGIFSWWLITAKVIPQFNNNHNYQYLERLPFGVSYKDNLLAIISNPGLVAKIIFTKDKLEYCSKVFGALGPVALLSPAHYILIFIPLIKNILTTSSEGMYKINSHYAGHALPFIYIAAIYGIAWLVNKIKNKKFINYLAGFLIFISLMYYGKTDGHKMSKFVKYMLANKTITKIGYLKNVPKEVSLVANFALVPHLDHRKYTFILSPSDPKSIMAECVVIDKNDLGYLSDEDRAKVAGYIQALPTKGYKQIFANEDNSFLIFYNSKADKTLIEKYWR